MSGPERHIAESAIFGDVAIPERIVAPAMRTVAANAKDPDDARQLLEMLGLIEPQAAAEEAPAVRFQMVCVRCNKPGRKPNQPLAHWPGTVILKGRDMCARCYHAVLNAEKEARDAVA